ncbi:tail fiber protein [Oceanihabitans sp. 2_MG-2023]|uniref:phage tail protein n=1 Tax=Oceanihabitans sp. 2_MG-2023 TaxID=3062661 RepID=UPI0026E23088|nr:tail fiber protein [Oceanihabitans sp. 2_MG-2023]MDO6595505.1 tail fiber protein [Oceanihabitans sp. 2_MG-2023]
MDPFIAQIIMFGGNFAPRGWALCNGQLLDISQNTALFSLLGTTYGGDGRTTFGLPDLRGRVPVHAGNGPGLPSVSLGQKGGLASYKLNANQLPSHTHAAHIQAANPITRGEGTASPDGAYPAEGGVYSTGKNVAMASDSVAVGATGGGQDVSNMQPFQSVNYIIALVGTFPSRS